MQFQEADVESVDFLMMLQQNSVYICGLVDIDLKLVGTLKVRSSICNTVCVCIECNIANKL